LHPSLALGSFSHFLLLNIYLFNLLHPFVGGATPCLGVLNQNNQNNYPE